MKLTPITVALWCGAVWIGAEAVWATPQLIYGGTGTALSIEEVMTSESDRVVLTEISPGWLRIDLNGQKFDAQSTATASGLQYESADDPGASTFALIDISTAEAITQLSISLGEEDDFLTLGNLAEEFDSVSDGIGDLVVRDGLGHDELVLMRFGDGAENGWNGGDLEAELYFLGAVPWAPWALHDAPVDVRGVGRFPGSFTPGDDLFQLGLLEREVVDGSWHIRSGSDTLFILTGLSVSKEIPVSSASDPFLIVVADVPEPGAMGSLTLGVLLLALRRRRTGVRPPAAHR